LVPWSLPLERHESIAAEPAAPKSASAAAWLGPGRSSEIEELSRRRPNHPGQQRDCDRQLPADAKENRETGLRSTHVLGTRLTGTRYNAAPCENDPINPTDCVTRQASPDHRRNYGRPGGKC
jgi:hypothetical protein